MYIEYQIIDGYLHVRHDPHKEFVKCDLKQCANYIRSIEFDTIDVLEKENARLREGIMGIAAMADLESTATMQEIVDRCEKLIGVGVKDESYQR